jgi:hypothetical protein
MFDLPQPFGPTTAVMPGFNSTMVFWAKDLKPIISRRFKRIDNTSIRGFGAVSAVRFVGNISQWEGAVNN